MSMTFRVFVIDGKDTRKIFFITQDQGDFYFSTIIGKSRSKFSRHQSGITQYKNEGGKKHILSEGEKISGFRGIEQLPYFAITKDVLEKFKVGDIITEKKYNGTVFVDLRNYTNSIFISPFLLEPGETQMLENSIENDLKNLQITIFTQTKPWIVLLIYEHWNKSRHMTIFTNNFR